MNEISIDDFFNPERYFDFNNIIGTQGAIYHSREEKNNFKAIVIGSNACDIQHNKISHIQYFPIFYCSDILIYSKRKDIKKHWKKILKQNHPEFIFLPPDKRKDEEDEREILIEDPIGAIISLQEPLSLEKNLFFERYNKPILKLSFMIQEKLSEKISYLFNRTPLIDPIDKELEYYIESKIKGRFDYLKILNYIKDEHPTQITIIRKEFNYINEKNFNKLIGKIMGEGPFYLDDRGNILY